MQAQQRNYRAFLSNPKVYNIEKAIREQEEDSWTVPRGDVRAGDRAIIWKAKGNDSQRGIVALAEVLTDPVPTRNRNGEHWVDQQRANEYINRVQVRYYLVPSILPLWGDRADASILKELSVARATGGTIFHVTPDQWNAIMELVGGWPGSTPEIVSIEHAIAAYAGKRRSGQGYATNADFRRAVEQYAMQQAKAFYENQGWNVSDVSAT
ncbi:MAG TPA: EVE domain-containing protein, partial [Ktedonobacteraceae bacterium]|nr:EVE domain-containing protein [Ktedonobacteraceae bacterium]